MTLHPGTNRQM